MFQIIVSIFSVYGARYLQPNYFLSLIDKCETKFKKAFAKKFNRPVEKITFRVHASEFCAGGEIGKDSCKGDGGAPLVCEAGDGRWHVVGLGKYMYIRTFAKKIRKAFASQSQL